MRNLLGWLAVFFCLAFVAREALGQFHPRDLQPTVYLEATDTYVNPADNADCSAEFEPYWCCTGSGTGTCDQAVTTFGELATCETAAHHCVGSGDPDVCCTGAGAGATCCWELGDSANGGRGGMTCPSSICPDGCIQRWQGIAWEGADWYKTATPDTPHAPIGRDLSQDDHELMCYVADCFANGLPCIRGRPPWVEPDGAGGSPSVQPSQDSTLEFEPADRTWSDCTTSEESWVAVLARPVPQSGNCDSGGGQGQVGVVRIGSTFRYDVDNGQFALGSTALSADVLETDKWQLFELVRDESDNVTFYIDGVDVTSGTPTSSEAWPPGSQLLGCAGGKNCDWSGCSVPLPDGSCCGQQGHEFQGDYAMILFLCSAPTAQNRSDLLQYAQDTWSYQNEPARRGGSQGAAVQAN